MDTIDNNTFQQVAEELIHANQIANIHTVNLTINGQHGGVDVVMHGFKHPSPAAVEHWPDEFVYRTKVT